MMAVPGFFLSLCILAGCATVQSQNAVEQEKLLSAAGFHLQPADWPDTIAAVNLMPQRELVPRKGKDGLYWAYADATFCKCLYVGNEQAYQRYKYLSTVKQISKTNPSTDLSNFGPWGQWGPWGGSWDPWGGPWSGSWEP